MSLHLNNTEKHLRYAFKYYHSFHPFRFFFVLFNAYVTLHISVYEFSLQMFYAPFPGINLLYLYECISHLYTRAYRGKYFYFYSFFSLYFLCFQVLKYKEEEKRNENMLAHRTVFEPFNVLNKALFFLSKYSNFLLLLLLLVFS